MGIRSWAALLALGLPNLGHATIFTFESQCAAPLTVDLGQATVISAPQLYAIPPVSWQGATIQQVFVGDGGTTLTLVSNFTFPLPNVSLSMGTDVLSSGGTPAMVTLADIAPVVIPQLGISGLGLVQPDTSGSTPCAVDTIIVTDPLDTTLVAMQQVANAAYPGADPVQDASGPYRLRTSTFQGQLSSARSLLTDAGCLVDPTDTIAGAFRPGVDATVGEHASGAPLVGTLDLQQRTFSGTIDADVIGERFSRYDSTHRFVVDDADGLYFGYGARVEGRRGVFMGLRASCPVPASAEAALAGWIDGSLAGLDPVDGGELVGVWDVDLVCDDGTIPQTWTVTDNGATYTIAGAGVPPIVTLDTASFSAASTYAITGPPLSVPVPPGVDPIPRGTVALEGPDAFSGTVEFGGISCAIDGVRL